MTEVDAHAHAQGEEDGRLVLEGVWSDEDTTPSKIEGALRSLLQERYAEDDSYAPARTLNLVVVMDREWRGEITKRLERVGRYHASRTIFCSVEGRRERLSARATMGADETGGGASEEIIEISLGERHLARLDTIVDPLVVPDLVTVVWSPHGHDDALRSLAPLDPVVLLDSASEPDAREAIRRAEEWSGRTYVVDLAWLRATPWRERLAATFHPPAFRPAMHELSAVTVRHRSDSALSGLLLLGWLASRLGWKTGALVQRDGVLVGRAKARRHEVTLRLEGRDDQDAPGLAGLTIETASGGSLSLDRGTGGLRAVRRARSGRESTWTALGASRGESGILGEGIRQALLRDPTYRPALAAAGALLDG